MASPQVEHVSWHNKQRRFWQNALPGNFSTSALTVAGPGARSRSTYRVAATRSGKTT